MKTLIDYFNESKESATFSLNIDDLDKIMYSLAFTAAWSDNVSNYDLKDYKKLFYDLLKGAKKSFSNANDKFPNEWHDYDLTSRGSIRRLNIS